MKEVVNTLGQQAAVVEEAALRQKALEDTERLLQQVDVDKYLVEGASIDSCLRTSRERDSNNVETQDAAVLNDKQ